MVLTSEQIDDLREYLQGSCKSIYDALEDLFNCNEDDIENYIDAISEVESSIFLCSVCGWWFEYGEGGDLDGEEACNMCIDENEE